MVMAGADAEAEIVEYLGGKLGDKLSESENLHPRKLLRLIWFGLR